MTEDGILVEGFAGFVEGNQSGGHGALLVGIGGGDFELVIAVGGDGDEVSVDLGLLHEFQCGGEAVDGEGVVELWAEEGVGGGEVAGLYVVAELGEHSAHLGAIGLGDGVVAPLQGSAKAGEDQG